MFFHDTERGQPVDVSDSALFSGIEFPSGCVVDLPASFIAAYDDDLYRGTNWVRILVGHGANQRS